MFRVFAPSAPSILPLLLRGALVTPSRALHTSHHSFNQLNSSQPPSTHTSSSSSSPSSSPSSTSPAPPLPASLRHTIDSMLRVDHAGEYGAQRIYEGQLWALGTRSSVHRLVTEMKTQEIKHLRTIEQLMPTHRVRPTLLLPLWDIAGFALGAGSALLGKEAAMACTVAVEEVITEHYNDQLRELAKHKDVVLQEQLHVVKNMIKQHRDDEEEHKTIGLQYDAEKAPFYQPISAVIKAGCHAAIWISSRI